MKKSALFIGTSSPTTFWPTSLLLAVRPFVAETYPPALGLSTFILGFRVRLVDFEFAYRLGDIVKDDRCGTDGYVSPEWCKATPHVADPRTNQELKVQQSNFGASPFNCGRELRSFDSLFQAALQNGAGDVYAAGAILLELLLNVDFCGYQRQSEEVTAHLDELMAQPLSHEERCQLLIDNLPGLDQCNRSVYVPTTPMACCCA